MATGTRFVVAGDNHGDMEDPVARKALMNFIRDYKPPLRIHSGDNWDFRNLRRGATDDEKAHSLQDDWDAGTEYFREFFDGGKSGFYLRGNHSFADDTELLTRRGWVPVTKVTENDEVAEFDPNSRAIFFSHPIGLVSHRENFVYHIHGRYTDQCVSSQHDVVLWGMKIKAGQLLGQHVNEKAVATSGCCVESSPPESDDWIRLLTWVVMDGCIVNLTRYNPKTTKARVQFKLSEDRKIRTLRALLDRMGLRYTFRLCKKCGVNKLQQYYIRLYGDDAREIVRRLDGVKQIPARWASLPASNLATFLETIPETDGCVVNRHLSWCTISENNRDVVQAWCVRNGWDCAWRVGRDASGFENAKPQFQVKISHNATEHYSSELNIDRIPYGRYVYCVTMPLGTVVSRRNGKVAFSGNCERLWKFADCASGLLRDYACDGIKKVEALVRRSRATMLPYDSRLGVLDVGKLRVIHGYACGVGAAAKHARVYGNCLFGHTHTMDVAPVENISGPAEARGVGCICKVDMAYNAHQMNKLRHQQGWIYGVLFPDGTYQLFQTKRIDDHFYAATEITAY